MPQLPKALRKARAARLRATAATAHARFLEAQVGRTVPVLIERDGFGRTPQFAGVAVATDAALADVRLTGIADGQLTGVAA
jgi:threonylcarbamoyladenosine tRNA methylthiotransferase MtaB